MRFCWKRVSIDINKLVKQNGRICGLHQYELDIDRVVTFLIDSTRENIERQSRVQLC